MPTGPPPMTRMVLDLTMFAKRERKMRDNLFHFIVYRGIFFFYPSHSPLPLSFHHQKKKFPKPLKSLYISETLIAESKGILAGKAYEVPVANTKKSNLIFSSCPKISTYDEVMFVTSPYFAKLLKEKRARERESELTEIIFLFLLPSPLLSFFLNHPQSDFKSYLDHRTSFEKFVIWDTNRFFEICC